MYGLEFPWVYNCIFINLYLTVRNDNKTFDTDSKVENILIFLLQSFVDGIRYKKSNLRLLLHEYLKRGIGLCIGFGMIFCNFNLKS